MHPTMIDVTVQNFETEVVAASMETPVLVDFWAPWCAPCKSLGPVLEKLETAYAGRFKLVKINSDDEQQISQMFGIRSLPTCVLLMNGQPVDGFAGALPEGQVRAFLDKHLPSAEEFEAEEQAEAADEALAEGNVEAAMEKLQAAVATDPANDQTRFEYLLLLLKLDKLTEAKTAFAPVASKASLHRGLSAIAAWLNAIDYAALNSIDTLGFGQFDSKIAANKRDFEARFGRAQSLVAAQQFTDAMDELLEILMRDKAWNEDAARKLYVAILEIITPPAVKVADGQIPPEDETVKSYRRRLSMIVLS
jgi:putative thioredoxin